MATVSPQGISPTDLTGYVERVQAVLTGAFGADLNLDAETPQGQLVGLLALALTEVDEVLVHVASGMSLNLAAGRQLDDWATLLRVYRLAGERSTVTATLAGSSGTFVPAGSRARTTDGAVFRTVDDSRIESGGTVDTTMESVEFGPVIAHAGDLNQLADIITGWTGITNAADATLGRDAETDAEFRRRYSGETAVHARESLEAIRARLLFVTGVTDARIEDNPSTASVTRQTVAIAARSLLCIVDGGADTDVASAIRNAKPAGIPTVGTSSATVEGRTIRWRKVRKVPVDVVIETTLHAGFPPDGIARLKTRLAAWAAGTWTSGAGDFDTQGLAIGQALDTRRLYSPLNSVPGHTISSIALTTGGTNLPATIALDQRITIAADDVTITVV